MQEQIQELIKKWEGDAKIAHDKFMKTEKPYHDWEATLMETFIADLKNLIK